MSCLQLGFYLSSWGMLREIRQDKANRRKLAIDNLGTNECKAGNAVAGG
jgi:hypothetical protein